MKQSRRESFLKEREEGFDLDFGVRAKLPEYNALQDRNMRHYFENCSVQGHLCRTGQIDKSGRVINLEQNESKLFIIEREFERAEKMLQKQQKEEEDARNIVRLEKLRGIEQSKKESKVRRIKEDRRIQREIALVTKEALGIATLYNTADDSPLLSLPLSSSSSSRIVTKKGERDIHVGGSSGERRISGNGALTKYKKRRKK
mmetsp:Transcript_8562/g.12597  ORF Transcript_8562/g.12597 Transcript_8562/m.12597 type:complete len:202 (-) Transcript_8562:646-1251(-)